MRLHARKTAQNADAHNARKPRGKCAKRRGAELACTINTSSSSSSSKNSNNMVDVVEMILIVILIKLQLVEVGVIFVVIY